MKKAVNQWCFPAEWSWEQVFDLCEEAGFEGIELCLDYPPFFDAMHRASTQEGLIADIARSVGSSFIPGKALRFDSPPADIQRVASLARDHGVAVASVLTIAQFHYSLIDEDPEIRHVGIELVRKMLDIAARIGAPGILVVPGVVTSRICYEDACRRLGDAIDLLKGEAESLHVRLGIENVWGRFLYSPLEMRAFVDRFASPYVGVHFDVGNVMQYGHPDQWIRLLGSGRLSNIHLKDYVAEIGNIRAFTYLFQGSVPWGRVMKALFDVGYDGYLIAEVPPYPFAPAEGLRDISRKMDILLGNAHA
jgi:L-ribulose-5-phosphate 3-epimerase